MTPVAHIYRNTDGNFQIASELPPLDTARVLTALAVTMLSQVAQMGTVQASEPEALTDAPNPTDVSGAPAE